MTDIWKRLRLLSSQQQHGEPSDSSKFTQLNDLASQQCGGKILFATDDWFAVAENLLLTETPQWKEGLFTTFGKWMDGWETRRKRCAGHDWCIIKLGVPGIVHGFEINTSFFTGNYAPHISIQAAEINDESEHDWPERISEMGNQATVEDFMKIGEIKTEGWEMLQPMSELKPGFVDTCRNYFHIRSEKRWTHLRVNIYPDGGIARLRVYGQAFPNWSLVTENQLIDLLAMTNGSICIGYSNIHFGHAKNMIRPGRGKNMADGWETARRLDRPPIIQVDKSGFLRSSGFEWAAFSLGHSGIVKKIEIDTNHFKGNFPDSVKIEGCFLIDLEEEQKVIEDFDDNCWHEILPQQKLSAHKRHFFSNIQDAGTITHIRVTIYPDGGISRIRLWGNITLDR